MVPVMTVTVLTEADFRRQAGERLRLLIAELGIPTAQAAADEMGITKQRLNGWLQGTAALDAYIVYRWMRRRQLADANFIFWGDWSALPSRLGDRLRERLLIPVCDAGSEADQSARASQEVESL